MSFVTTSSSSNAIVFIFCNCGTLFLLSQTHGSVVDEMKHCLICFWQFHPQDDSTGWQSTLVVRLKSLWSGCMPFVSNLDSRRDCFWVTRLVEYRPRHVFAFGWVLLFNCPWSMGWTFQSNSPEHTHDRSRVINGEHFDCGGSETSITEQERQRA